MSFTDIDECITGDNDCDVHATCTDTEGSYTCSCNDGFLGTAGGRARIGTCQGKRCTLCNLYLQKHLLRIIRIILLQWYFHDKTIIIIMFFFIFSPKNWDIDECLYETDDCDLDERATCNNTEGAFTCACRDGFMGDGKSCTGKTKSYASQNLFTLRRPCQYH